MRESTCPAHREIRDRAAKESMPRMGLGHRRALFVGGVLEPIGQAIAAEAREIHQVDILDVGPRSEVLDQAPEGRGFEFRSGLFIDGHGRYPAVAELRYHVDLVIDFAISQRKQGLAGQEFGYLLHENAALMSPWPLTVSRGYEFFGELI